MNTGNDNAFPIPGLQDDESFNGLTVRQYFAAKCICLTEPPKFFIGKREQEQALAEWSKKVWKMADALLKAEGS